MTRVTKTEKEVVEVERQETYTDTETREKEVDYVRCNFCEEDWREDGPVEMHDFAVDPNARTKATSIEELDDLIESRKIIRHLRATPQNSTFTMARSAPDVMMENRGLHEVINEEIDVRGKSRGDSLMKRERFIQKQFEGNLTMDEIQANTAMSGDLAGGINIDNAYPDDGMISYFDYRIDVPVTSKKSGHLCEFCYNVLFG